MVRIRLDGRGDVMALGVMVLRHHVELCREMSPEKAQEAALLDLNETLRTPEALRTALDAIREASGRTSLAELIKEED